MDLDPLTSFTFKTPPRKVRRLVAVQPTPQRLPELLSAFGARQGHMSASRMEKQSGRRGLRLSKERFSYAEPESDTTPQTSPGSSFGDSFESSKTSIELHDDDDSEDELQSMANAVTASPGTDELNSDDVIHVASRRFSATRKLPARSTRSNVSYATPKKFKQKKKISFNGRNQRTSKLTSDLFAASQSKEKAIVETERNKIHNDIAKTTEPRRNAFLVANKQFFLPLLPESNYINKLLRQSDDLEQTTVPYKAVTTQPTGIEATLHGYQLTGLSFLVYMHDNGASAILGDEMGLGKTLQTLSLVQHLKNRNPAKSINRPVLVVCPLSVLSSWMNEAKKWTPNLTVVRFHGPKAERENLKNECRTPAKSAKIDVIVTTYESFIAEQSWFHRAFIYRHCVLDEGHKIKNSKANVAQALQSLQAEHRLLLTGTPLQNNLEEMWALLHWLYPNVFDDRTAENFKQAFNLNKGKASPTFMDDARRLLEVIMLRRMKHSPGVDLGLPPKKEVLLYVPLTPMQRFWYTRLLTRVDNSTLDELFKGARAKETEALDAEAKQAHPLAEFTKDGALSGDVWAESRDIVEQAIQGDASSSNGDWRKLMNLLLQLRKACTHPYILPGAEPTPYYLGEHVKTASGKFIVLDKLIDQLVVKSGTKILIFAGLTTTLNLCEDLLHCKGANSTAGFKSSFQYLRLDGGTPRAKRDLAIRMFNDPDSEFKIMLISTRAGGLGINLASASNVIFLDEDWNPQVTIQAEARVHRIGQKQPVTVYKILSAGTVEEQMMGRIRKKLYLSAKITESMQNIHDPAAQARKRKRGSSDEGEEEAPQLDETSLKSILRRGAHTLARPAVDAKEMLDWDWATTLEKCQDRPDGDVTNATEIDDEESWLNTMERVECAVFEGKKHQKQIDEKARADEAELTRADRRAGKNTTVMIDGFAISKESLNCGDWEAVPTMAGKDPRLADPVKVKKAAINNQDFCQHCRDGGSLIVCSGCPRSYHLDCLERSFQQKSQRALFFCPQHECTDCQAKTANAGGLIYRCRWCEKGYCGDCLDWDVARLIGETLPEYEILGHGAKDNAWYIECQSCAENWVKNKADRANIYKERERIGEEYEVFLSKNNVGLETSSVIETPTTISEVGTPRDIELELPTSKKSRFF